MSRQRLIVVAVIAGVAVAAGMWLLWPKPATPLVAEATAGPYLVRITGTPPKVGINPLVVEITGSAGESPTPESVTFEPAMPQMGHATTPVVARPDGTEHYRGDVNLSMPGQWEITVRISNGKDHYDAVLNVTTTG
ncbi:FixH family protein [Mycobacterium aquaticum]|uniref:YtkA-like domain-containing protein n=1 Tax=Mycobacterium aquaticum TaxID=1927124 RepID=A0A1X0AXY6_9MYCO|nr:FixH family protein [Mycobacterium aquaticum]ORA34942.1 hypothetical protein BST13_16050 [Mycobacterium aquaticum]